MGVAERAAQCVEENGPHRAAPRRRVRYAVIVDPCAAGAQPARPTKGASAGTRAVQDLSTTGAMRTGKAVKGHGGPARVAAGATMAMGAITMGAITTGAVTVGAVTVGAITVGALAMHAIAMRRALNAQAVSQGVHARAMRVARGSARTGARGGPFAAAPNIAERDSAAAPKTAERGSAAARSVPARPELQAHEGSPVLADRRRKNGHFGRAMGAGHVARTVGGRRVIAAGARMTDSPVRRALTAMVGMVGMVGMVARGGPIAKTAVTGGDHTPTRTVRNVRQA